MCRTGWGVERDFVGNSYAVTHSECIKLLTISLSLKIYEIIQVKIIKTY